MQRDISHYFDWAATSPADEDIVKQALETSLEVFANPSSQHSEGAKARKLLETARENAAQVMGVNANTLFFTSGGTESNHIALLSVLSRPQQKGSIIISAIEHPAIREQANALKNCGWEVISVLPDKNGIVSAKNVTEKIKDDTALVCFMAVNNETGAIQPIYEIADAITQACKGKRKPKFHVDCVQGAGKIEINLAHKGIDSASFSAHKICGPRGIGLLYLANEITPFMRGGGQEKGVRSGTENIFGAIAFSQCLERYWISSKNTAALERLGKQREYTKDFIQKLAGLPFCSIIPENRTDDTLEENFSPWVLQASFENIPGQVMVRALDAKGFYISTGSACSASKQSRPILEAMNVRSDLRQNAVRFSFGVHTTKESMNELFSAVKEIGETFNQ